MQRNCTKKAADKRQMYVLIIRKFYHGCQILPEIGLLFFTVLHEFNLSEIKEVQIEQTTL